MMCVVWCGVCRLYPWGAAVVGAVDAALNGLLGLLVPLLCLVCGYIIYVHVRSVIRYLCEFCVLTPIRADEVVGSQSTGPGRAQTA